jgi:hypothetical protein
MRSPWADWIFSVARFFVGFVCFVLIPLDKIGGREVAYETHMTKVRAMADFGDFPNEDRFDAAAARLILELEELEASLASDPSDSGEKQLLRHRAISDFLREEFGHGLGDKEPVLPL